MADFIVTANPKAILPDEYKHRFKTFLCDFVSVQDVEPLMSDNGSSDEAHCSWVVETSTLIHFDSVLAFNTLNHPRLLLPLFEDAFREYQEDILRVRKNLRVKKQVHIRLQGLPPLPEFSKSTIGDVKANETSSMVQISGTIVRSSGVKMLEMSRMYECQNARCKYRFRVYADPEQDNVLPHPRSCPKTYVLNATVNNADNNAPKSEKKCNCTDLREIDEERVCVDYQEIRVQDRIEHLAMGAVPRSITIILHADLVDRYNPGDDVMIIGTPVRQWRFLQRNMRASIETTVHANNVMLVNERDHIPLQGSVQAAKCQFENFWGTFRAVKQEWIARNLIVRSVCPQLYGMYFVKMSLLLALIGGVETAVRGGIRRRSNIHMLMVGDPGCGKSQLLRFAAAITPRSVLTTGIGTTGAGLTCSAVRVTSIRGGGGDWSLEAGALVLANGGICCIDEFNSIKESDRATIHEAMEQQTLSIAKAGLVVKLNTKTSVIASCNPKGAYDMTSDISANTNIASPLLSRFDIILVMIDNPQKEWDKFVSTFLLSRSVGTMQINCGQEENGASHWDLLTLQQYIHYVKTHFKPELKTDARLLLMRYYSIQRQSDERSSARTTIRLLESLVRLAEAHARLMFRSEVTVMDAVIAILIVAHSQSKLSLLDNDGDIAKENFPDDPQSWYLQKERHVFSMINYSWENLQRDVLMQRKHVDSVPSIQHNKSSNNNEQALMWDEFNEEMKEQKYSDGNEEYVAEEW